MEPNHEAAFKAKQNAEKRFSTKDFVGARKYALKAQTLHPEMDGISQMLATFEVYIASESKVNGEIDFYSVLGLKPSADRSLVKRQYRKLAVLLHPDKNKTVGADGAFKLVSEAWTLLSDNVKRASYDLKRAGQLSSHIMTFSNNCCNSPVPPPPTFWTVCTSCQVQYEYLRKYVNKRLSCKNCHATFIAVELGASPHGASYPVCPWSNLPDKGCGGHGCGVTFYPTTTTTTTNGMLATGNGVSGHHSAHGSDYVSNVSYQWNTRTGTSTGYVDRNGPTAHSDSINPAEGYLCKPGKNVKVAPGGILKHGAADSNANSSNGYHESPGMKTARPYKRKKVEFAGSVSNGSEGGAKIVSEAAVANGNGSSSLSPMYTSPVVPTFDPRSLLIEKARTEIRKKLEEIRSVKKCIKLHEGSRFKGKGKGRRKRNITVPHSQPKRHGPVTLTVPDSDFHDFDEDRTEECFRPKQIWALYDEEDGMPRLYCLVREVISVKPFKIQVSYLSSKTDSEFGTVNWINSGFTKSCGGFRACNSDVIEQVNMFSHLLSREKVGRGGCARIYPRRGDIWAVYRNWSPRWNRNTPDEVRHKYEMVEVLDDYSEELSVGVIPLVKLDGYKTVYRRNSNKDSIRWIPRREMVRFSHQVPSWFLKEVDGLPDDCWDLDPAATPDELLQAAEEAKVEEAGEPCQEDTLQVA